MRFILISYQSLHSTSDCSQSCITRTVDSSAMCYSNSFLTRCDPSYSIAFPKLSIQFYHLNSLVIWIFAISNIHWYLQLNIKLLKRINCGGIFGRMIKKHWIYASTWGDSTLQFIAMNALFMVEKRDLQELHWVIFITLVEINYLPMHQCSCNLQFQLGHCSLFLSLSQLYRN